MTCKWSDATREKLFGYMYILREHADTPIPVISQRGEVIEFVTIGNLRQAWLRAAEKQFRSPIVSKFLSEMPDLLLRHVNGYLPDISFYDKKVHGLMTFSKTLYKPTPIRK